MSYHNVDDDSDWLNQEKPQEPKVSEETLVMERTLIDIKDKVLKRNISTIKEKKMIMNMFTSAMNTTLSPELFAQVNIEVVLETWKVLINFFNNLNKKNISDLIKQKSQYISEHSLGEYIINKNSIVDKSIIVRMTDLLDFLNALAKLLDVAKHNFINGEDFKDLISWIIDQVIGEDLTIFGDYVENFYDLNGKYSELYRYHFQTMLNVVLINTSLLDRNLYDKLLESQYLIFTEENTTRFSNCYSLSIKILGKVMKHRLLGKVHGTWEKLLVNAFKKFLMDTYSVKKVDEDFFAIAPYMLEWSFVFDNKNYPETSRVLIDNLIKAKKFNESVFAFLKKYLDFLPYDVEYQVTFGKNEFFLDDLLRLIKFLLLIIIESHEDHKSLIPETFNFKEFPQNGSDLRIREYEYVNSSDCLNILAEYISLYFYFKENTDTFKNNNTENLFSEQNNSSIEPLENNRVKKDVINYIMPLLRRNIVLCTFIESFGKACEESINSEKIVPLLTVLLLKYKWKYTIDCSFANHINMNKNMSLAQKYMFNSSLIRHAFKQNLDKYKVFAIRRIVTVLFTPFIEALSRLNENIPSMTYFVSLFGGLIHKEKDALEQEQWAKTRIKLTEFLKNIKTQSPVGSSLEIFKFWKNVCLLIPYVDNNILQRNDDEDESLIFEGFDFRSKNPYLEEVIESKLDIESLKNYEKTNGLTTFELILRDWLPKSSIIEDGLSFSNFFYWGYSQDTDVYVKNTPYTQERYHYMCYSHSNSPAKKCNICKEETTFQFGNSIINNNKRTTSLPFIKSKILLKNDENIIPQNLMVNLALDRRSKLMELNPKIYQYENGCPNNNCPQYVESMESDIYEGRGIFRSYKCLFYLIKYFEKSYAARVFDKGLGWMRLLLYLAEDSVTMSENIHNKILRLLDIAVSCVYGHSDICLPSFLSNYDIFSVEYLSSRYPETLGCLMKISDPEAFYTILDNENDLLYYCQLMQVIPTSPFQQLTNEFTWNSFKLKYLESSESFDNACQFDVFLETFSKKVCTLNSEEKTAIVNSLITNIKDEINSEKCHDIPMLKKFLLIVSKIVASPTLMDGQSKNKTLKLWISIHDISYSGLYQSGSIGCLENLFKRLDFKSQSSVLVNIQQTLIEEQDVQVQFEMLTSLSKISRSLMVFCFKSVLSLLNERTFFLFKLMLSELCKWYNFSSNSKLYAALGYDFLIVIISDLLKSNLTNVPIHVILSLNALFDVSKLLNVYEICEKLLKDKNLSHLFVCCCLILTKDINKIKSLGILEFQSNDVIKADVLYSIFENDSSIKVVDQLQLTKVEEIIPKSVYNYTKFKNQLKLLDTSSLATIASEFLTICPNFDKSILQSALYESKPISFLKLSSLSVPDLLICDPSLNNKVNFFSSLMIELPVLEILTDDGSPFSVYEFGISAMRKLKIVYLLVVGLCSKQNVIDRVTLNFLEYIIKIDYFESLFDTFRSFLFMLMSNIKPDNVNFEMKLKVLSRLYSVKSRLDVDSKEIIYQFACKKGLSHILFYRLYQYIFADKSNIDQIVGEPFFLELSSAITCLEDLNTFMTDLLIEEGLSSNTSGLLMLKFPKETLSIINWKNISSIFAAKLVQDFQFQDGPEVTKEEKNYFILISEAVVRLKSNTKTINDLLDLTLMSLSLHLSEEYRDADEDLEEDFFLSISKLNLDFNLEETVNISDFTDMIDYDTDIRGYKWEGGYDVDKDSYFYWLNQLWTHLTLHLMENSIFNFVLLIDKKFNRSYLKEEFLYSIIVCISTEMDKNVITEWGKFFNTALLSNPKDIYDFRAKALTFLKMFLLIRSLKYDEDKKGQSKSNHFYQLFDLEKIVHLCLALNYNELAFMLAEEDKNILNQTDVWKDIFKGLNSEYDMFLKTSIPMDINLNKYLHNSKEYSEDSRFTQSVLGFNLASIETNYNQKVSLSNIQQSFVNQGDIYLAQSLNSQENEGYSEFKEKFESYYKELQSWDVPLSNVCDEESYLFSYNKSKLLFNNKNIDEIDNYGNGLIKKLMIRNKEDIEDKIVGFNDTRLNELSDMSLEKTNMLVNAFKMTCIPPSDFLKRSEESDLFSIVISGLGIFQGTLSCLDSKTQCKMLKYYNENVKVQVYSDVFVDNLNPKYSMPYDGQKPKDQVPSQKLLKELGFMHLLNLSYIMERAENDSFNNFNSPIKELIRSQKFIELLSNYDFEKRNEWEDYVSLENLVCRWNSGDKISSFYLLNNMLEREFYSEDDIFQYALEINKIKWTLESKKETLQNTWCKYYDMLNEIESPHDVDDPLFSYHSKDIYTINTYYFGVLNSRMDNYSPDYKEMDTLLRKHAEIRQQQISCKKYLTLFQNNPAKKKKMTETLKVISANEKFVAERYHEIQRSIQEDKDEIINMTVSLISILSRQICSPGKYDYKETENIDMFFSLWFELINFFNKDYFDIDKLGNKEIEKLQIENRKVNFKHILEFQTIADMPINKENKEENWIKNRCTIVGWKETLKEWVDSIEAILKKNISACLPWLGTIFAKISSGHIEVNENCNIFTVLLECYLNKIIISCVKEYPEYSIHLANSYMNYSSDNNEKAKLRSSLIYQIMTSLVLNDPYLMKMADDYKNFNSVIKDLSLTPALKKVAKISLTEKQNCKVIFKKTPEEIFDVFSEKRRIINPLIDYVILNKCKTDLQQYHIVGIDSMIHLSTSGLSRPRIFYFQLKNGTRFKVLAKGNDDLKSDEIMLNVMKKINNLIFKEKKATNLKYKLVTYQVFPMGHNFGMMEFIKDVSSLNDILKPMHKEDEISQDELRKKMDAAYKAKATPQTRVKLFTEMCKLVTPRYNEFFRMTFLSPETWYKAKKTYAMSLAITSLIGYILGIGDRHMSNVMMNCQTGDLVHIDFGITFDSGKKLAIPERIPFRYTADMRDALGVYGHYGAINRFFEDVYSTLRTNQLVVSLSLMNLKLDPLYKWSMEVSTKKLESMIDFSEEDSDFLKENNEFESQEQVSEENLEYWKEPPNKLPPKPIRKDKTTEFFDVVVKNTSAFGVGTTLLVLRKSKIAYSISEEYSKKSLDTVSDKILGGKERQSVESCIQSLLNEAESNDNLGLIFCGWCPFY